MGRSGLITINQMFDGTDVKSFSQLQEQYGLPSNDLYRYFQIRHYITSHKEREAIQKNPNIIEAYFISIAEKGFPNKKHVSHLYKRLMADDSQNTWNVRDKWELELNIIIEDAVWESLCVGSHKGINSQLWKEFDWKLKIRFFNTPFLISKYVQGPSVALCWRKCGKIGDHTHIFWDCPVIEGFWKSVKEEIGNILEMTVPLEPMLFLLGAIPTDTYDSDQRYILRILLLIAKKIITVNWENAKSPTIIQWKHRLKQVYTMERMTASLQIKMDSFTQRWNCVKIYLDVSMVEEGC